MRSIQGGSQYETTARQTKLKAILIAFGISAVLLMGGTGAISQNVNAGEIRGTVTDSAGASIPRVEITLTNENTGVTTTTTDSGGVYDVPQLTPGIYSISFKSSSFKTAVQQNVLLQNGPITVRPPANACLRCR
jgi:hypothetical protein